MVLVVGVELEALVEATIGAARSVLGGERGDGAWGEVVFNNNEEGEADIGDGSYILE